MAAWNEIRKLVLDVKGFMAKRGLFVPLRQLRRRPITVIRVEGPGLPLRPRGKTMFKE